MDENCESSYWFLAKHSTYEGNFFYEYLLMNQIPCPYVYCHYSNSTTCPINKKIKVSSYIHNIYIHIHIINYIYVFVLKIGRIIYQHTAIPICILQTMVCTGPHSILLLYLCIIPRQYENMK